jgi:hypothetical protein
MMNWKPKTVKKHRFRKSHRQSNQLISWFGFFLLLIFLIAAPVPPAVTKANAAPASKKLRPTDRYALIFGTVWGPDNRPVYGVRVKIRQLPKKKPEWELYSDHAGEFAQRVAAGEADYVVSADLKGVKTSDGRPLHLAQDVNVHIDDDERVDIGLHLTL